MKSIGIRAVTVSFLCIVLSTPCNQQQEIEVLIAGGRIYADSFDRDMPIKFLPIQALL
jgi:hypothetical protein